MQLVRCDRGGPGRAARPPQTVSQLQLLLQSAWLPGHVPGGSRIDEALPQKPRQQLPLHSVQRVLILDLQRDMVLEAPQQARHQNGAV